MKPKTISGAGKRRQHEGGWILIYVIAMIVMGSILFAASLRIMGDLRGGANKAILRETLSSETTNASRIMDALLRREIQKGSPDPFSVITPSAVNAWLTIDPLASTSPFSVTQLTLPARPAWFTSRNFVQDNPILALHGLATAWHVAYDLPAPFEIHRTTTSNDSGTSVVWRPTIWEVPTGQLCVVALEQIDLSRFDFPLNVSGPVLAPFGMIAASSTKLTASSVISTLSLPGTGVSATTAFVDAATTVGWMGSPYDLLQPTNGPTAVSTALQQLQDCGLVLWWDGQTLTSSSSVPAGIAISVVAGERRVVVDLNLLPEVNGLLDPSGPSDPTNAISAYTINCVGPLAMSRGIVVNGAGSQSRYRDAIITNGAVRLYGSHNSPLMVATSYGAVVFDDPSAASPTWRLFLHAPTAPERVTASTAPSTNGSRSITNVAAAGGIATNLNECTSNVLKFAATYAGATSLKIGFAPTISSAQPDLYVLVNPGSSTTVWASDETGTMQQVDSLPWSGSGPVALSLTYERAGHALVTTVGSASSRVTLGSTIQPRFETAAVLWSTALTSLELSIRGGGTRLYAAGAVQSPSLTGGILFGSKVSGTLSSLSIQRDSGIEALPLTARFLFFSP